MTSFTSVPDIKRNAGVILCYAHGQCYSGQMGLYLDLKTPFF